MPRERRERNSAGLKAVEHAFVQNLAGIAMHRGDSTKIHQLKEEFRRAMSDPSVTKEDLAQFLIDNALAWSHAKRHVEGKSWIGGTDTD